MMFSKMVCALILSFLMIDDVWFSSVTATASINRCKKRVNCTDINIVVSMCVSMIENSKLKVFERKSSNYVRHYECANDEHTERDNA